MKMTLIGSLIVICSSTNLFSQTAYYGCDPKSNEFKRGDLVILNVPSYTDGRFNDSDDLSKLVHLIQSRPELLIEIRINVFFGSSELSMDISESLRKNLIKILKAKCKISNYTVAGLGQSKPFFIEKDSPLYRSINTRIEVFFQSQ